jgi:chloramphenicol O-acetyltransferase
MVSGFVLLASGSVEESVQIDHANADRWHLALLLGLAALAQSLDDL